MNDHDNNQDRDRDRGSEHDRVGEQDRSGEHDNGGDEAIASAPAGGAVTSIAALQTAFKRVDTTGFTRTGLPMLLFKSRENNGTWVYGQKRTIPEEGSRWAVNLATFKWGYVCFPENGKAIERLVPVNQPKPLLTDLPDTGYDWQDEWTVNVRCISGADAGVEADLKATTDGGLQAVVGLFDTIRDRINSGQHGDNVLPIVLLEKDSYPHPQHGRTSIPLLTIVEWMSIHGPAAAPASPPPPPPKAPQAAAAEQPRRRRVA
jgi:hypothetical protein